MNTAQGNKMVGLPTRITRVYWSHLDPTSYTDIKMTFKVCNQPSRVLYHTWSDIYKCSNCVSERERTELRLENR